MRSCSPDGLQGREDGIPGVEDTEADEAGHAIVADAGRVLVIVAGRAEPPPAIPGSLSVYAPCGAGLHPPAVPGAKYVCASCRPAGRPGLRRPCPVPHRLPDPCPQEQRIPGCAPLPIPWTQFHGKRSPAISASMAAMPAAQAAIFMRTMFPPRIRRLHARCRMRLCASGSCPSRLRKDLLPGRLEH